MDAHEEDLSSSLKEFDKKITTFSSILEKFGLDVITKMGQTNMKIKQLTDMVEELSKVTIDIKGFLPQLSNVIKNQKSLEDELNLVKSLITNLSSTPSLKSRVENTIDRDESATNRKDIIVNQINELEVKLETKDDPKYVKTILEQLRVDIFEFTGGHTMLSQFAQIITRLDSAISLNDLMKEHDTTSKTIKVEIMESIPNWINKLMIKN